MRNDGKDDTSENVSTVYGTGIGHQAKNTAGYVMMMMMMMMMVMITSTHEQRDLRHWRENYGKFQASERQSMPFILNITENINKSKYYNTNPVR